MSCSRTGADCKCTYSPCERKGNCCQCVAFHSNRGEFTACFFSTEAELSHDRSFARLLKDRQH